MFFERLALLICVLDHYFVECNHSESYEKQDLTSSTLFHLLREYVEKITEDKTDDSYKIAIRSLEETESQATKLLLQGPVHKLKVCVCGTSVRGNGGCSCGVKGIGGFQILMP